MNAHTKRIKWSHVNNVMMHIQVLEKITTAKPKTSRRKNIMKTRAEINEKLNGWKSFFFFERISKIDKLLTKLSREKEKICINTIKNEKDNITADTIKIQRTMWNYFESL